MTFYDLIQRARSYFSGRSRGTPEETTYLDNMRRYRELVFKYRLLGVKVTRKDLAKWKPEQLERILQLRERSAKIRHQRETQQSLGFENAKRGRSYRAQR